MKCYWFQCADGTLPAPPLRGKQREWQEKMGMLRNLICRGCGLVGREWSEHESQPKQDYQGDVDAFFNFPEPSRPWLQNEGLD